MANALTLTWVVLAADSNPVFGEEVFEGTPEDAVSCLQSRVNRKEIFFGQVLEADGKVFKNVA